MNHGFERIANLSESAFKIYLFGVCRIYYNLSIVFIYTILDVLFFITIIFYIIENVILSFVYNFQVCVFEFFDSFLDIVSLYASVGCVFVYFRICFLCCVCLFHSIHPVIFVFHYRFAVISIVFCNLVNVVSSFISFFIVQRYFILCVRALKGPILCCSEWLELFGMFSLFSIVLYWSFWFLFIIVMSQLFSLLFLSSSNVNCIL